MLIKRPDYYTTTEIDEEGNEYTATHYGICFFNDDTRITEEEYNNLIAQYIVPQPTEEQIAEQIRKETLINEKKALLNKYREDLEQVDLFGMTRDDYAEKKALCKELVLELRELER